MKKLTSPIRSGLLIAAGFLWGCGFAAIDPYDSTVVRTILNKIGWTEVTVGSVVYPAIAMSSELLPTRVTTLNLALRMDVEPITELPDEISQLPELVTLSLKGNALTGLPDTVSTLHKLARLDLSSNKLERLPEALKELPLQVLVVNHNPLKSLPDWIDTLSRLQSASFIADSLATLHAAITRLDNLTSLNLDSNLLQSLPEELTELTGIRISVNGNRLCSIDTMLAQWLDRYQIGTDWLASQQCESKIASIVTDPATGTVIHITADTQNASMACQPIQLTAVEVSSLNWTGSQRIIKAVEVRFNDCFTSAGNYFLVSFSWKDIEDSVTAGSELAIQYVIGAAAQYLGGSVDSVNKTISMRVSREGRYLLTMNRAVPTTVRKNERPAGSPAQQVQWRFALRNQFIETSFTLERLSEVRLRLFALDGKLIAETTGKANAGNNTLRFVQSAPRSSNQFIVELQTNEFRVQRTMQNF